MSAQKTSDIAVAASKAFAHAFDMEDSVGLIRDILVAIDAIAITDVEAPYSSAITRLVTFGEKAINEIGGHRDEIASLLSRHFQADSVTARAKEGAAA
jgi:rRNA processing protein Krr1/Pno1